MEQQSLFFSIWDLFNDLKWLMVSCRFFGPMAKR